MKMPRNLDAQKLVKALEIFGYQMTRQTGSHIRLTTVMQGEHHLTIPVHSPLKIGTLDSMITDVAQHFGMTKNDLLQKLFPQ